MFLAARALRYSWSWSLPVIRYGVKHHCRSVSCAPSYYGNIEQPCSRERPSPTHNEKQHEREPEGYEGQPAVSCTKHSTIGRPAIANVAARRQAREAVRGEALWRHRLVSFVHSCPFRVLGAVYFSGELLVVPVQANQTDPLGLISRPCYTRGAFPARQQCLYFLPLPQGQGSLRPIPWRREGINGRSELVS